MKEFKAEPERNILRWIAMLDFYLFVGFCFLCLVFVFVYKKNLSTKFILKIRKALKNLHF